MERSQIAQSLGMELIETYPSDTNYIQIVFIPYTGNLYQPSNKRIHPYHIYVLYITQSTGVVEVRSRVGSKPGMSKNATMRVSLKGGPRQC